MSVIRERDGAGLWLPSHSSSWSSVVPTNYAQLDALQINDYRTGGRGWSVGEISAKSTRALGGGQVEMQINVRRLRMVDDAGLALGRAFRRPGDLRCSHAIRVWPWIEGRVVGCVARRANLWNFVAACQRAHPLG